MRFICKDIESKEMTHILNMSDKFVRADVVDIAARESSRLRLVGTVVGVDFLFLL